MDRDEVTRLIEEGERLEAAATTEPWKAACASDMVACCDRQAVARFFDGRKDDPRRGCTRIMERGRAKRNMDFTIFARNNLRAFCSALREAVARAEDAEKARADAAERWGQMRRKRNAAEERAEAAEGKLALARAALGDVIYADDEEEKEQIAEHALEETKP